MIRLQRSKGSPEVKVTFVIDEEAAQGPVSVVGSFNDWSPYAHILRKRSNGTRSVAVTVPAGTPVHFRYLAEDGHWFDDPQANVDFYTGVLGLRLVKQTVNFDDPYTYHLGLLQGSGIPDPWYGDADGFADTLAAIEAAMPGLLRRVRELQSR